MSFCLNLEGVCVLVCVCVCVSKWGLADCQSRKHSKTNEGIVGSGPGQHTSLIDGQRLT